MSAATYRKTTTTNTTSVYKYKYVPPIHKKEELTCNTTYNLSSILLTNYIAKSTSK